jgi:hypothetical protein
MPQMLGKGEGGDGGGRRKYRVLKLKQEWTQPLGGWGAAQRRTPSKSCGSLAAWPVAAGAWREDHLAAVGVAERELQAAARALSPDGPATAAAQRQAA